jgi:Zn-dependent protease with chaperone function
MNFFKNQEEAKSKTSKLLFTYFVTVILTALLTSTVICLIIYWKSEQIDMADLTIVVLIISGLVSLFIFLTSLYKIIALKNGGEYVARLAGATPVNVKTSDPLLRKYINVVEEMSIASGTPVPKIYIMEDEMAINAFAAGFEMDDAVIAVSMGALKKLNRDELQGVIAHEFSHIFNGDMKLNIKLIGYLFGLSMISQMGYHVLRSGEKGSSNSRSSSGSTFFLALGLMATGAIGMFFASLIKASISRQREFLADASAVQFTRNPLGISGVLKKILATDEGSILNTPKISEVSHLFFCESLKSFSSFFATHPPLSDRLLAVDPHFNMVKFIQNEKQKILAELITNTPLLNHSPPPNVSSSFAGTSPEPIFKDLKNTIKSIGVVGTKELNVGKKLIAGLPEVVKKNCYDKNGAQALCLALFADQDGVNFDFQKAMLEKSVDAETLKKIINVRDQVRDKKKEIRIPIVDLCSNAIRSLDENEKKSFLNLCRKMVFADEKITLSEFILLSVIEEFVLANHKFFEKKLSASELKNDCHLILSFLAYCGNKDKSKAQEAFDKGYAELYSENSLILEIEKNSLIKIKQAFHRLRSSEIGFKKKILSGCYQAAIVDNVITSLEYELLRLISKILMLPMPIDDGLDKY